MQKKTKTSLFKKKMFFPPVNYRHGWSTTRSTGCRTTCRSRSCPAMDSRIYPSRFTPFPPFPAKAISQLLADPGAAFGCQHISCSSLQNRLMPWEDLAMGQNTCNNLVNTQISYQIQNSFQIQNDYNGEVTIPKKYFWFWPPGIGKNVKTPTNSRIEQPATVGSKHAFNFTNRQ